MQSELIKANLMTIVPANLRIIITSSRHEEPEHLSLNLVWALRPAQTIRHTKFNPCVQVLLAGNLYCGGPAPHALEDLFRSGVLEY